MADSTTGGLPAVRIGTLPPISDIYDDFLFPGEFQGQAVHINGRQFKQYAENSVEIYANTARGYAEAAAASAKNAANSEQSAANSSRNAAADASMAAQDRAYISGMTVSSVTLGPGDDATVTKTTVGQSFNLKFGIPRGYNGVAVAAEGQYAFNLEDGHLICYYSGDTAPPFVVENGRLYLDIV